MTEYTFPESETQPHARVIADSISDDGHRVTTMVITHHRFVLAEVNTHRMFSRSSASSRAIPTPKTLDKARRFPARFHEWRSEQPGMSGGVPLKGLDLVDAQELFGRLHGVTLAEIQAYLLTHVEPGERLHKSLLNRFLEPFQWHTAIITSTEWDNFFPQRVSPLAQPELNAVAELMLKAYQESTPERLQPGDWHLPFITPEERLTLPLGRLKAFSVARCARVSYLNHDGSYSEEADLALFERLCNPDGGPPHAAPLEHVCTPDGGNVAYVVLDADGNVQQLEERPDDVVLHRYFELPLLGNFLGWRQLRHEALGF